METRYQKGAALVQSIFSQKLGQVALVTKKYNKDKDTIAQLEKFCERLYNPLPVRAEITIAYGGSPDPLTTRTPAYLLPALYTLRLFLERYKKGELKHMPRLRVLHAVNAAICFNKKFDRGDLERYRDERLQLCKIFMEKYFPDLVPYTLHSYDYEYDQTMLDLLDGIKVQLQGIPQWEKVTESLLRSGADRATSEEDIFRYILTHPLNFNDIYIPTADPQEEYMTISLGGHPESRFNEVRKLVRMLAEDGCALPRAYTTPTIVVELIQEIGSNPPYYYYKEYDMLLSECISNGVPQQKPATSNNITQKEKSKQHSISQDMRALYACVGCEEEYHAFCRYYYSSSSAHRTP